MPPLDYIALGGGGLEGCLGSRLEGTWRRDKDRRVELRRYPHPAAPVKGTDAPSQRVSSSKRLWCAFPLLE